MLQTATADHPDFARVESSAHALLEVVTELAAVMEEENRLLAAGFPAGLVGTSERKGELTAEYADLWDQLRAEAAQALAADPDFVRLLMQSVGDLRQVANENLARLEAAMTASRRRVEAALAALHDDAASGRTYGADGELLLAHFPTAGANFHA